MNKYREQIKQLREMQKKLVVCGHTMLADDFAAAADSIENLLRMIETQKEIILRKEEENRTTVMGQMTLQKALHEAKSDFEALLAGVHDCADVCVLCTYTDSNPDCDGECESCEKPCACWHCDEKASKFVWKGRGAHG